MTASELKDERNELVMWRGKRLRRQSAKREGMVYWQNIDKRTNGLNHASTRRQEERDMKAPGNTPKGELDNRGWRRTGEGRMLGSHVLAHDQRKEGTSRSRSREVSEVPVLRDIVHISN